jgi:hypothetical protein
MESSKSKFTLMSHFGSLTPEKSKIIKEPSFTSLLRNGTTKCIGGTAPLRAIPLSTHKKFNLKARISQILMEKPNQQWKK